MSKLLLLLALLAGCDTTETYEDVSAEPRSRKIIGTRYEVVGSLDAYGIRRHSKAPVERVHLIPPPGIGGTMIAFEMPVRQGSRVTVRKVIRTNRLFGDNMDLEVELEGTPLPSTVPVIIQLVRGNEGDGYLQLNPELYLRLPQK